MFLECMNSVTSITLTISKGQKPSPKISPSGYENINSHSFKIMVQTKKEKEVIKFGLKIRESHNSQKVGNGREPCPPTKE